MTFEEWEAKYIPIKNWLSKVKDEDKFETYGVELGFVIGVDYMDSRKVWTLVEGDSGNLWVTNGYHLVNRLNYFITTEPYEGEEDIEVLYMEFDADAEDEAEELAWQERVSALASARTEEEVEKILLNGK